MAETGSLAELDALGKAALGHGRAAEAAGFFERALALEEVQNSAPLTLNFTCLLADAYIALDRFTDAESRLNEASPRLNDLGIEYPFLGLTLMAILGACRYKTGDPDQSSRYLKQLIAVYRAFGNDRRNTERVVAGLIGLGRRCQQVHAIVETEQAWQAALEILSAAGFGQSEAGDKIRSLLFDFYRTGGRTKDAARVVHDIVGTPSALWSELIARTQLAREMLIRQHRVRVDRLLSCLLRAPDDPDAARTTLDVLLWRRGFGLEPYRAANRGARRDPAIRSKLETLKTARADMSAVLFELQSETRRRPGEPKSFHTRVQWEGIGRSPEVDELERDIFAALTDEDVAEVLQPADTAEIATRLPADAALIEYWRCRVSGGTSEEPHYLALVLRNSNAESVSLIDLGRAGAIDDQLVRRFQAALQGTDPADGLPRQVTRALSATDDESGPGSWRELGDELRRLVFDPLLPALKEATRLFIVPDGLLTRISFATLPAADDGFLLDSYTIGYLESGRELRDRPFAAAHDAPVVLGAPDYNRGMPATPSDESRVFFAELPGTIAEGQRVAEKLAVTATFGADVTKQRIAECRTPVVLHISTHGVLLPAEPVEIELDPTAPIEPEIELVGRVRLSAELGPRLSRIELEDQALRSMLAVSGVNTWLAGAPPSAETGNGWLNAEDIARMDLSGTRLAVLSACETGLGAVQIGEAVLGLRSALSVAGARTIVTSLWKVPDDLTAELMVTFYEQLRDGSAGAPDALRAAQRNVRQRFRDRPDLWGAFICHGDPSPLPADAFRR